MPLSIGQTLQNERYRIDGLLGQGGMGAVYRAWDENLHVVVAIKENLEASPEARSQFIREARMLARLAHPNLPRVTDYFFIAEQGQYLVMDYVEGEDLQQMLDRRGIPTEEQALEWTRQVCDALNYLHTQPTPVIHRDIKPANIRIRPDGRAMLVDFGIAKIFDPQGSTTVGARAVTPGYSPPEQYGGGRTDARSDVYAIGATLYHLLTGQAPPESVRLMTEMASAPPPRRLNPGINPGTEAAIMRAMSVSTDRRFQSAAEFKAALTSALERKEDPATLVSAPRLRQQAPLERTAAAPRPATRAPHPATGAVRDYGTRARPSTAPPARTEVKAGPSRIWPVVLGFVGFLGLIGICAALLYLSGAFSGDGPLAFLGFAEAATATQVVAAPTSAEIPTQTPEEAAGEPTAPPGPTELPTQPPTEAALPPNTEPTEPPSPTPLPSATPLPTATPIPTATPLPSPTPKPTLSPFGIISQGWSMGGGNASNSSWNAAELDLYPPFVLEWEWAAPGGYGIDTLTVADGVLYMGGSHGNDDNSAYAVRLGENDPLWRFTPPDARGANDVHVAVGNGRAFFGGQLDDNLYCLDALSGALLYSVPDTGGMYTRPPILVKGRVYAPSSNGVMAVNAQDGSVFWRSEGGRVQSDNAMIGSLLLTGSYLERASSTMDVTALDIFSGEVVWRSREARAIKVAADQGRVYAIVSSANNREVFDTVVAYDVRSGAVAWRQYLGWNVWFFSKLAITDDKVFVAGSARDVEPQKFFVLDKNNGALLHQTDLAGAYMGALAVANGVVYAGTNQGLWAFHTDNYGLLWEKSINVSDLAISDGRLFIATRSYVLVYRNAE